MNSEKGPKHIYAKEHKLYHYYSVWNLHFVHGKMRHTTRQANDNMQFSVFGLYLLVSRKGF